MLRLLLATALLGSASLASATTTYLTAFTKTSGIYTNLNKQFPNAGPGVPGSRIVTPNSAVLFTPQATGEGNPNNLNYANNGIGFKIASDATGHDFTEIGASFGVASVTLPVAIKNVDHLYLLMSAYNGTSFNITLNGTGGRRRPSPTSDCRTSTGARSTPSAVPSPIRRCFASSTSARAVRATRRPVRTTITR